MGETSNKCFMSIQSDWDEALRRNDETAWVSSKAKGQMSVNGSLHCDGLSDNNVQQIKASDGFVVRSVKPREITVADPSGITTTFISPRKCLRGIHSKNILCMDVASGIGVSSDTDDRLLVWDSTTGECRRNLEGHLANVYTCSFFPSGIVILSGGADMQLRIWSAETADCPVVLKGHVGAVTGTAMVERGKNVISVSKDHTALLWDCGTSSKLATILKSDSPLNACALMSAASNDLIDCGQPPEDTSDKEVGTSGKILVTGSEGGAVEFSSVHTRTSIRRHQLNSAVNSVAVLGSSHVMAGCQSGDCYVFDIRNLSEHICRLDNSGSAVLCICAIPSTNGAFVGRQDGSCSFYNTSAAVSGNIQLTGSHFEPINSISVNKMHIYTAARDATIRLYSLEQFMNCLNSL